MKSEVTLINAEKASIQQTFVEHFTNLSQVHQFSTEK